VPEIDLLGSSGGSVTAAAGSGKTQLIADTVKAHRGAGRILVLTHTNAGRSALETRLAAEKADPGKYRVATIDSWMLRLAASYPERSAIDKQWLQLADKRNDYPRVRQAAVRLLASGDISELVQASYSRVLVDEYQDCSQIQHTAVREVSKLVPTCVLGDPQQSIFAFDHEPVDWDSEVLTCFPELGTLKEPWRWKRVDCTPLGTWLGECREALKHGERIDLRGAPKQFVTWRQHDHASAIKVRQQAAAEKPAQGKWSMLVLADSDKKQSHRTLARRTPGLVTIEALDMEDLVTFAATFDITAGDAAAHLVVFLATLMAQLDAKQLLKRLETLLGGVPRKDPSPHEAALVKLARTRTFESALEAALACRNAPRVRLYRPEVYRVLLSAMRRVVSQNCTFKDAARAACEANRHAGRPAVQRAVGSTLLLKGLECDVAVVLNPAMMNAQNLYVALTRGSRQLVVCSESRWLQPAPPNDSPVPKD
jgi:DNA helicase-2/ATP-dependent DNA helicase PcrA